MCKLKLIKYLHLHLLNQFYLCSFIKLLTYLVLWSISVGSIYRDKGVFRFKVTSKIPVNFTSHIAKEYPIHVIRLWTKTRIGDQFEAPRLRSNSDLILSSDSQKKTIHIIWDAPWCGFNPFTAYNVLMFDNMSCMSLNSVTFIQLTETN